ncbi:MAG: serine hydrolase [Candidatus Poribacteria bacterium]|nr:serine hydrolase [Candidatus Poribacteria bacterium]MDE0505723.1 serine hydrolase [Candidatus Poribacteria bacterium]
MSSDQISALLQQGISDEVFPGAVAVIAEEGKVIYHEAFGHRMVRPQLEAMRRDTIFDVASLTKPIVVATLVTLLAEDGILDVGDPVKTYLPEFNREEITLLHLLTHTSGLPAWRPVYLNVKSRDEVSRYLGKIGLEYPAGQQVVYSCLGYILLGELIEHTTGQSLDRLARKRIFSPAQMMATRYCPPSAWKSNCAATEDSNRFERGMANGERYNWRAGVLCGEVHDENANFLGGVAGNSGLFSTAGDLSLFCQILLNDGDSVLSSDSVDQLSEIHTAGLNSDRSVGWIILEDGSLYHSGFTGTSIRIHPGRKMFAILLTNRVHPEATREGILGFRDRFHELIFGSYN